jgi:tRNA-dihydrouridine synthase B
MQEALKKIFDGRAMLAPMLATTDIPFRRICREFGAGLVHTEMVSTEGIARSAREAYRHAIFDPSEKPVAIQLVAASPETVTIAIRELLPLQPTVFDINCGCPDSRICEAGAGAALLDDPIAFAGIIHAAATASDIPVSVKMRAQGHMRTSDIRTNARIAEDSGAAYITVHARTRSTRYDQQAQWEQIAVAKQSITIPVIGNGDIFSADDARRMLNATGCDAVMIARGCLGAPWIFTDILEQRNGNSARSLPEPCELRDLIRRHAGWIEREFGPIHAIPRVRKHIMWYSRHFEDNEPLRKRIFQSDDLAVILDAVDSFLASAPPLADPETSAAKEREQNFRKRVLYWMDQEFIDA